MTPRAAVHAWRVKFTYGVLNKTVGVIAGNKSDAILSASVIASSQYGEHADRVTARQL